MTTQDQPKQVRPDLLGVTPQLRRSVLVTCASMATTVLVSGYSLWSMRQIVMAFTGGDVPLMFRVMMLLVATCALFTALGVLGYVLAALPVLARGRQRAIERLLEAQGWLWTLIGVTLAGLLLLVVVGKLVNSLGSWVGSLWPF